MRTPSEGTAASRQSSGARRGGAEAARPAGREQGTDRRSRSGRGGFDRGVGARLAATDIKLPCEVLDAGTKTPSRLFKAYFYTRSFELHGSDLIRLRELADLFVSRVDWDAFRSSGVAPVLRGSVTGHADCRRSLRPDNLELSQQRAFEVKVQFLHFVGELAAPLLRGGEVEDQVTVRGEGTADCELDPDCELSNFEVLARYRRADLVLELPTRPRRPIATELPPGVPEEVRDQVRDLTDRYPDLIDYITPIGWYVFIELLKDLAGPVGALVDLLKAYEGALVGRDFILEPFRLKGWAYGATAWAFGEPDFEALRALETVSAPDVCGPLIDPLRKLREKDVIALEKKAIFKPYHVEKAQAIWESALMEGCVRMQRMYTQRVPKQLVSTDTHRAVQRIVRSLFHDDPRRMASALYEHAHAYATMFAGSAETELMRYLDAGSYPD